MLDALLAIYAVHDKEFQFVIAGALGMVFHYYKTFFRQETKATLTQWFGFTDSRSTFLTISSFIGAMFTALASGTLDSMNFYAVVLSGFTAGFSIDSAFNSVPDKKHKRRRKHEHQHEDEEKC